MASDWKTYKGLGPWTGGNGVFAGGSGPWPCEKVSKYFYDEGDETSSAENPVWNTEFPGDVGRERHDPCGYWWSQPYVAPSLYYPILFGCGSNVQGQLGSPYSDWINDFTSIDISNPIAIGTSEYITIIIKSDGTLWGVGNNELGALGQGYVSDFIDHLVQIGSDNTWVKLAVHDFGFLAIKSDGTLWACGDNGVGQLGLGATYNVSTLTQVGVDTDWADIAASEGGYHSLAVKVSGTLWTAGGGTWQNYGQLGLGDKVKRTSFTNTGITNVRSIDAGQYFSMVVLNDGTMWGTGRNNSGQLGLGDTADRLSFTQISGNTWADVKCGAAFSAALSTSEHLFTTGANGDGALAQGDFVSRSSFTQVGSDSWASIETGESTLLALDNSNILWIAGYTITGSDSNILIHLYDNVSMADTSGDTLFIISESSTYGVGNAYNAHIPTAESSNMTYEKFTVLDPAIDWTEVDCGSEHSVFMKSDGTVWGCGTSRYIGLGTSGITTAITSLFSGQICNKIVTGRQNTYIIKSDGTLWGTGNGSYGQLGQGNTTSYYGSWIQIGSDNDWKDLIIASSSWHLIAIKNDNSVYGVGKNGKGQLGLGDYVNKNVLTLLSMPNWAEISTGEEHTLFVNASGELWTVGFNTDGQLGLGDNTNKNTFQRVGADSDWWKPIGGEYYSYALKTNRKAYSTGGNYNGQLAQGDITYRNVFTEIVGHDTWDAIACGCSGSHVLGVKTDKTLWTVGRNDFFQLGRGVSDMYDATFAQVLYDNLNNYPVPWTLKISAGILHSLAIQVLRTQ